MTCSTQLYDRKQNKGKINCISARIRYISRHDLSGVNQQHGLGTQQFLPSGVSQYEEEKQYTRNGNANDKRPEK